MRRVNYSVGSLSREVEDDWETSGEEYTRNLERSINKTQIRDRLNRVIDMIKVLEDALHYGERDDNNVICSNVLYFEIEPALKQIEKDLTNVSES